MEYSMFQHKKKSAFLSAILLLISASFFVSPITAQPIVDTVKAIQKANEKFYRQISTLDPNGESYAFTNVIKWKITDRDLFDQIKEALTKAPFNVKADEYRIDDIYVFAAPVNSEKVEPFHVLLNGVIQEKKTGKKKSGLGGLGDDDEDAETQTKKAFSGKTIVQLMRKNPSLLENINIIQGSNIEIPGEIVPTGTQLVKDIQMRYALNSMFGQFYSKTVILDAQRALYKLPTSEDFYSAPENNFAIATDETRNIDDSSGIVVDSTLLENSGRLPEDVPLFEKMGRKERMFDLSVDHLRVNATNHFAFEAALGNPEIGLPFWTSGQGNLSMILRNMIGTESDFRIGLAFPVSVFGADFGKFDEFLWSKRNLSGGWGATISAYFAGIDFFSSFNLPVAFKVTFNPSGSDSNKSIIYNGETTIVTALDGSQVVLAANKTFYRTSLIAQIYVPVILQLDLNSFVNVSVGFGIHNVQQSYIPTKNDVDPKRTAHPLYDLEQEGKTQDIRRVSVPFNPLVNIQYVNHRSAKFGVGVAFDHLFTFSGWIEIINDRLRLETSYSSAVIRDPKPWEHNGFFQITPRFYF